MTPLELIFTALGEETTRQLAIKEDAQGFDENKDKATKGGQTAGDLLETYEQKTGLQVVSTDNFWAIKKLDTPELPFE
jgi:DNA-damage-inducible protein D